MPAWALVPRGSPKVKNKPEEVAKRMQVGILLGILKAQLDPCRLPTATLCAAGRVAQGNN